ncbi:MAG: hypothetical protein L0Z62_47740 [Gemmataceae bacterium]|nr:hypothetical protein [Gemmataceae bacterium]
MLTTPRNLLVAVLLGLAVIPSARADLDPELKTPYDLRVVLAVAEHRLLTTTFREQLERELRGHLQATYGKLARVEVTGAHRFLKEVRSRRLQALDSLDDMSGVKSHFILLDYADGQYRLQARQHDGWTGLCSPVIRRDQTPDRRLVSLAAARLVDRDFGLAGTVTKVEGDQVEVTLKGGGLGVDLGRWLSSGDVFAVTQITGEAGQLRASRAESVLLRVNEAPRAGVCRCRLFQRYQGAPLSGEGVRGYRCLRLTTTHAPLRLRLVDQAKKERPPLDGLVVRFGRSGFTDKVEERVTGEDGLAVTAQTYSHIAFAQVISGGRLLAQLPIEIVDDGIIPVGVEVSAEAVAAGELLQRKERWVRRAREGLRVVDSRFSEVSNARSAEAALELARAGLKLITAEASSLADERDQLVKSAGKAPGRLDLSEGEQHLQRLQEERGKLEQFIARLDKIIQQANSPETRELQAKLEQARLKEAETDYDGAIRLYQEVLSKRKDLAEVRAHLEKLRAAWQIKEGDSQHTQARAFVSSAWPRLDPAEVAAQLPRAVEAFKVLRQRGDRLTPERLLRANVVHAAKLKKELEVLGRRDGEDVRARTKTLLAAAEQLRILHNEVRAFLDRGKPAGK